MVSLGVFRNALRYAARYVICTSFIFALLHVPSARADELDVACNAPPPVTPVADLTMYIPKDPNTDRYFIVFAGGPGGSPITLGHMFVVWGEWDFQLKRCYYDAFGLYSQGGIPAAVKSILMGPVPAQILNEDLTTDALLGNGTLGRATDGISVEVADWMFFYTEAVMRNLSQTPQPYVLGSQDCVSFAQNIASRVGLVVPTRDLSHILPLDYLKALKDSALSVKHFNGQGMQFDGPLVDGIPAGPGTMTFSNGSTWKGPVGGMMPLGNGTYSYANGDRFEGPASLSGQGTYHWANGDMVTGQFVDGSLANGGEVQYISNNFTYTGSWGSGHMNGSGLMKWSDGRWYQGQIVNGAAQGQGKGEWSSHYAFDGAWADGHPHGFGTITYPDGKTLTTSVMNGVLPPEPGRRPKQFPAIQSSPIPTVVITVTPGGGTTTTVTPSGDGSY